MDEFSNRMYFQRRVLSVVNDQRRWHEELCGLSESAIERWAHVNGFAHDERVTALLKKISKRLYFLATKSQEQVTENYGKVADDVASLTEELTTALE